MSFADIRRDYSGEPLSETASDPDPYAQFARWFAQIRDLEADPTAFALATATRDGKPSVRTVLLKDVDERGFVFYTNHEGRKGRELLAHPQAALCFHWQPLEEQVRVEGDAAPVADDEADAYFASRPRGSQIGAWASLQSRPIEREGDLERRYAEIERRAALDDIALGGRVDAPSAFDRP